MICLGTIGDGRSLFYDATLYEFRLDRALVSLEEVRELDDAGHIAWFAPEQRDWMLRIDADDLDGCNRDALGRHGAGWGQLSPEEQVQADAKRDDSVLAGKIVDADPALVAAVADALEQRGAAIGAVAGSRAALGAVELPEGMEALAQVQKQQGRKMTVLEHYLMRRVLKNDDREKARREKEASALAEKAAKDTARRSASDRSASESHALHPEPDAILPSRGQVPVQLTRDEEALVAARERRLAMQATAGGPARDGVPGAAAGDRRRSRSARVNGQPVNPDGTPRETWLTRIASGLGQVVDSVAPLAGVPRGGGAGGMGAGTGADGAGGAGSGAGAPGMGGVGGRG